MKSTRNKICFQTEDKAWRHLTGHNRPNRIRMLHPNHLRMLRYITARISDNLTPDFGDIVWVSLVEEMEHEKS